MRYLNSQIAALAVGAAFTSSAAFAMPVTHSLDVTVDTSVEFEDLVAGSPWSVDLYPNDTFASGLPFSLGEGDTIEIDVATTGPGFNLVDLGFGATALEVILNPPASWNQAIDNPGFNPVLSYDQVTTVTVTSSTGDFKGPDPFIFSNTQVETSPIMRMLGFGDYTDTSVNITAFNISTTFTNITFLPGYEPWAASNSYGDERIGFFTLDDFTPSPNPSPVPAPAALALLGLGLVGLGVRRRTAA